MMGMMKKGFILILSLLFIILGMSYVCAVDNDTSLMADQNQDLFQLMSRKTILFLFLVKKTKFLRSLMKTLQIDK